MKIKHVITTLALAGLMGAGAFAGIKATQPAREAKAATQTVYFKDAGWWAKESGYTNVHYWGGSSSTDWPGVKATLVSSARINDGENVWKYEIPTDSTGFMFVRSDSTGTENWGAKTKNLKFSDLTDGNDMFVLGSEVWGDPGADVSYAQYTAESSYAISVDGGADINMVRNSNTEYVAKATVAVGQTLTLKVDGVAATLTPNVNKANNLTSASKIKVGGTFDVYVKTATGHETWVVGYNDCNDDRLQNFCNEILNSTISDGVCSTTNWNNVVGAWNYVREAGNKDELIARFNAGEINFGADYAHTSVINEARTRYAWMHEKFGVSLEGATLPASTNSITTINTNNSNYIPVLAIVISSISIVTVLGAALMIRRRKEDR